MNRVVFFFVLVHSVTVFAQVESVTISGVIKDNSGPGLSYVNVVLLTEADRTFVTGTVTNEEGRYTISNVKPGYYFLQVSFIGYKNHEQTILVGKLSSFLDLGSLPLEEDVTALSEVVVEGTRDAVAETLDKKIF